MTAFDMAAIKCNCDEFFTLYNVTKAGTLEMCQRKMEHTQRVAENCMYIAKHMGLNEYDCALAWTIGELHDFARFGQAVATKTFVDSERFNHARLGARLLFTHRMIDDIITNYDEISDADKIVMEKAVYHHSDYALPEGLTERERLFCVIIRDADKADIFRTSACGSWETTCAHSKEEIMNSDISPEFVAAFREHRTANNKKRTLPADFHVAHIALCFGLETDAARRLTIEQGYLPRLVNSIEFTREDTRKKFAAMKAEVNKFIKKTA